MQRLLIYLATLCLFVSSYANEYFYEDSCCDCGLLNIEYLFMKPSVFDPYFAVTEGINEDEPSGTRFGNLLPYHSGVRAKGFYNLPCEKLDLYAEGLYFKDKRTRTLSSFSGPDGTGLATKGWTQINLDDLTDAMSSIDCRLWSVKGGLRYGVDLCCPFFASVRFAIQYANLSLREQLEYTASTINDFSFVDITTHGWGIGPEAGFDVGYHILSCLSFVVRGSYALLVGRVGSSTGIIEIDDGDLEDNIFLSNNKMCIVSPVSECKLGLKYALPFNCFCSNLEIGYNIMFYQNMLERIRGIGDTASQDGLSFDHFTPFMIHGLYLSFSAGF